MGPGGPARTGGAPNGRQPKNISEQKCSGFGASTTRSIRFQTISGLRSTLIGAPYDSSGAAGSLSEIWGGNFRSIRGLVALASLARNSNRRRQQPRNRRGADSFDGFHGRGSLPDSQWRVPSAHQEVLHLEVSAHSVYFSLELRQQAKSGGPRPSNQPWTVRSKNRPVGFAGRQILLEIAGLLLTNEIQGLIQVFEAQIPNHADKQLVVFRTPPVFIIWMEAEPVSPRHQCGMDQ